MIPTTFDELLLTLNDLVGKELPSIKKGAEITLTKVDRKTMRVELMIGSGKLKTRPFSELQEIWKALQSSPAVHVDSLLGGSGSSRNQPETIMANLPFVAWGRIDGKKHLVLLRERTHAPGTLDELDAVALQQVRLQLAAATIPPVSTVIVTQEPGLVAKEIQKNLNAAGETLATGAYGVRTVGTTLLVLDIGIVGVPGGTYSVLPEVSAPLGGTTVRVGRYQVCLFNMGTAFLATVGSL